MIDLSKSMLRFKQSNQYLKIKSIFKETRSAFHGFDFGLCEVVNPSNNVRLDSHDNLIATKLCQSRMAAPCTCRAPMQVAFAILRQ